MTNNTQTPEQNTNHVAKVRQLKRISPFWLLPFIALCIGAILFFQIIQEQGTSIKITFTNGEGLVAGKTQVRFQGLQIGEVKKVNFTPDLKRVEVIANIYPEASRVLRENTKFWLVQPSASLAGISGLDALVSGNYITLQPGDGEEENEFIAENEGPIAEVNEGDLLIHLIADDLGSISAGASVYYKKMPVGKIADYRFTKDQEKVEIDVVIEKNYANLIKKDSRFWNISGFQADVNLGGISVNMESLNSVVQGAVSFDSPDDSPKAESQQRYTLYPNLQAAKRGINVDITLPNITGLEPNKTLVFYQGMPVGVLSELGVKNDQDPTMPPQDNQQNHIQGKLLINPNMSGLLKENSTIILRDKKLTLGNLNSVWDLFKGYSFEIIAGDGNPKDKFTVIRQSELLLKQPNSLVFTLTAPETYGVSAGQPIYYNGIIIGELISQDITIDGVTFKAAISAEYRQLIGADTKFVAASNLDLSLGLDGLNVQAAPPEKWLEGGVRILAKTSAKNPPLSSYPLYRNVESAENGITSAQLTPTITLTASNLPSISQGSLVLYRQYEVGKILDIRPQNKHFDIDVFIYPKYRHLLTTKSRFWVESAAQVDITTRGISIQASPLARTLKGAISFDNEGSNTQNKTLYVNELRAKSAGQEITLITTNASNLSKGMALRYMGLNVGEIEQINLDKNNNRIIAKALINPNYMDIVAKENSRFQVISPEISAGGIQNLDSLLQPYIDIDAGSGKRKTQFTLRQSVESNNKYDNGVPFILETNDALNLTSGSPIYYRGIEVGKINRMELNSLGDRVLVHILIANKHHHLVRQNSQFWISSGYNFELGWQGAQFNTGSVQQFLKGGISFATPSGRVVQPVAKSGQRFLLQIKRPEHERQWNQATAE
ncbi:PqiB family protein [Conservatibacter flavescens]|uniref:MCE family protein n=1 Tax=Conservatibacter flavescens TaxID=28161 RepID=A0A2M8S609_9PAST|nr:MlaD family protein [Conservatibacter flavescens]PJG86576.1 MCE family protein [Conservatibacter flavescens]